MQKSIPEIQKDAGLSEMNEALKIWKNAIDRSLKTLKKDAEKLGKIRELLQNADDQRGKLKEKLELCRTAQTEAARKLTEDTAQLNSFRTSCEFASEKEASDTLEKAEIAKQASEKIYKRAADALDAASSAKQNAETLIAKYQKEIPAQEENFAVKKAAYMDFMQEKQMTEEAWKQLAKENSRDDEKELTDTVNAYREAKAAAIAQKKAANEAIGEAQKPDLDKIKAEKEETETVYQMAEKKYNQLKMDCKNNQEIFTALSARMEKRKAVVEEHARIDALYRMTSGNVSGSRMDLETFVQRYYLERILYAANRRFQEMSAGQFELRMYDLKKAGEGKNRGLDLMVYSTVTGKEREVRTLSGGESFMAALSLALGMADQIKQSSAAINLDMMFIDEGFGSLDEHSRNQAVRVLQEMAEGSRLIGIISHVSELKQEIEDQLIVTKDENGSHVKWQIS
jgi:exonuclease SbcC